MQNETWTSESEFIEISSRILPHLCGGNSLPRKQKEQSNAQNHVNQIRLLAKEAGLSRGSVYRILGKEYENGH